MVPWSLMFAAASGRRGKGNSALRTAADALKAQGEATGDFSVRPTHAKEQNDEQYQSRAGGG
jgi:hypothetical protein